MVHAVIRKIITVNDFLEYQICFDKCIIFGRRYQRGGFKIIGGKLS